MILPAWFDHPEDNLTHKIAPADNVHENSACRKPFNTTHVKSYISKAINIILEIIVTKE